MENPEGKTTGGSAVGSTMLGIAIGNGKLVGMVNGGSGPPDGMDSAGAVLCAAPGRGTGIFPGLGLGVATPPL